MPAPPQTVSTTSLARPRPDPGAEVEALARRYLASRGGLIRVLTRTGTGVEDFAARLPARTRARLDAASTLALRAAYAAAAGSHVPRRGGEAAHRAAAAALGAMGGLGGLPTALAELPVTTTMVLRSLQEIARDHGEDPAQDTTRIACLQVLGAGGPLAEDDGTDFAFLGARLTLTGPALQGLIAGIAPRFAAALVQRLAAKAVPALGAAAGATVNLAFMRYYQEMAHVHFGLRRLARQGAPEAAALFRAEVRALRAIRA